MSDIRPNIWLLQAKRDVNGLIQALQSDDADTRRRAAVALRALGASSAVKALRTALETEEDTAVRSDMFESLEHLLQDATASEVPPPQPEEPEETPIDKLIAQLDPNNPEHTLHVIEVLGEMQDAVAAEPLIKLFDNRNLPTKLRLAAAEALLKMESAPAVVTLLRALRGDSWHVRRNAAGIMGHLRTDWAVEPLGEALRDENPFVRRTARAALKRIGTPEAHRILNSNPDDAESKLITRKPRRYNISSSTPPAPPRSKTSARGTTPPPPAEQPEPDSTQAESTPPPRNSIIATASETRPSRPKSLRDRLIDTKPLPPKPGQPTDTQPDESASANAAESEVENAADTRPLPPEDLVENAADTRPLPPEEGEASESLETKPLPPEETAGPPHPIDTKPLPPENEEAGEDLLKSKGDNAETIKFGKDDLPDVPAHPSPEPEKRDTPPDSAE